MTTCSSERRREVFACALLILAVMPLLACRSSPPAQQAAAPNASTTLGRIESPRTPDEPKPTSVDPSAPASSSVRSCSSVGPTACDMPPRPLTALCSPPTSCLATTADAPTFEDLSIECDSDPRRSTVEGAFSNLELAPAGSGVTATAVMDLLATQESTSRFDASYLVAQLAEGSCLVDFVHDWEMSWFVHETTVQTRWEITADGFRLHLEADRVLHDRLDEGQAPYEHHCEMLSYDVAGGRFTRLSRESLPGYCPSVPASERYDDPAYGASEDGR